ncbi:DNA repair protein, putative [Leishmania tarentolae]|uniref:RanBP-type and C3HC4-type zinc finger-containing protein 1 n=1 Tax=Leishmania tarentolae TaxID=5689 RepID=A0A640KK62_LEITA|nr:DNA repair protein, putative [Leishmania tarentolae]
MDDVDTFLASLDQFSSPTIDAGIRRQQECQIEEVTASNEPSASETAPYNARLQHRRRQRDSDTGAPFHSTTPERLLFENSGDSAGRNRNTPHIPAASSSSHTHTVVGRHLPNTWWCLRCKAENTAQMQSCALCHRRRHRVEGPRLPQTSQEVALSSDSTAGSSASLPLPSQVCSTGVSADAHGRALGHEPVVVAGPGEISCPRCTFLNSSSRRTCEMCDGALPKAVDSFTATMKNGGAFLQQTNPSAAMSSGMPLDFGMSAGASVPPTVHTGMGGGGRPRGEPLPEPAPSRVTAATQHAVLQEDNRETLSLSPVALESQSTQSSSSSFSDRDNDDEESEDEWNDEETASRDTAGHRELVHFLEALQSVKFDTLPCAAVPATMRARGELRPFQLQALYWLLSREQPQRPHARVAPVDSGSLSMQKELMSTSDSGAVSRGDEVDHAICTGRSGAVGGSGCGRGGALGTSDVFDAESWPMTLSASPALRTRSCPPSTDVSTRTPNSGTGDDTSMSLSEQEMTGTVRGGVFADYMGLGKTRTLIALCESTRAPRIDRVTGSLVESTATLIVCPTSLLTQWVREIHHCVERPAAAPLRVLVYYGTRKRHLSLFQVAQSYDYVLTTYQTLSQKQPPASRVDPTSCGNGGLMRSRGIAAAMAADFPDDFVEGSSFPASADDYDVDRRLKTEVDKLFMIRWGRIILDEAHYIRNMRTRQSRACLKLSGVCRWVVTATPVQNSLNDLYPLLRFLAVPHFSSLGWWNNEIVRYYNLNPLHPRPVTALSILFGSILLRRTPDSIVEGKPILELPPTRTITYTVGLSREETRFYQSIHTKATQKLNAMRDREAYAPRTPLATFTTAFEMLVRCRQTCLHPYIVVAALRRCHRLPGAEAGRGATASLDGIDGTSAATDCAGGELAQKQREDDQRTARAMDEFIQTVVLRRLRVIKAREFVQSLVEEIKDRKLESRECIICLETVSRPAILPCAHVFCEECINHALQATRRCPLCKRYSKASELLLVPEGLLDRAPQQSKASVDGGDLGGVGGTSTAEQAPEVPLDVDLSDMSNWSLQLSSKTQYLIDTIRSLPAEDKVVVFSTFLTYLRYAQHWLQAAGVSCALYSGSMTMKRKQSLLELFHDAAQPASPRVLLATISSCGVGLNLTCANHCFLMEPSWNPGTEEQALNRIYRIGQTKPVTFTKLIADGTIEQNINQLCERKRALSRYCFSNSAACSAAAGGSGDGRLRTADLLELFAPEKSSESSDDDDSNDSS